MLADVKCHTSFGMIRIRINDDITGIMIDLMNRRIVVPSGFIGSFDLPRSEWSPITDPDPDHPKGAHPNLVLNIHVMTLSSVEASLCCGEAGEKEKESMWGIPIVPRALSEIWTQ